MKYRLPVPACLQVLVNQREKAVEIGIRLVDPVVVFVRGYILEINLVDRMAFQPFDFFNPFGTDIARMDSNKQMSYGLYQYNGTATWDEFSSLSGITGTPMNPAASIRMTDWAVSNGFLGRWTCAHVLKMVK